MKATTTKCRKAGDAGRALQANEIRIAVAEACGFVWYRIPNSEKFSRGALRALFLPAIHEYPEQVDEWKVRADGTERIANLQYMETEGHLPDYPNDLNAMCAAVVSECKQRGLRVFCNMGTDGTWECIITESETPNCIPCDGDHYGAGDTLCQAMAEAFLRMLGRWKE